MCLCYYYSHTEKADESLCTVWFDVKTDEETQARMHERSVVDTEQATNTSPKWFERARKNTVWVFITVRERIGMKVFEYRQGLAFQFSHLHQIRENLDFLSTCPGVEQKEK